MNWIRSEWICGRTLALILVSASSAFGSFSAEDRGTTTAPFLKLGVGARAMAMGEANSAVAEDATALYWNPAGLARVNGHSATFMHAPYLEGTFYDFAGYAQRSGRHAWGVSAQYFSAGSLAETDENNASLGTFTPNDLALSAAYAIQLSEDGWSGGLAGKYIQSKIIATARTVALDAGLQSRLYFDRLRLALAVSNVGGKMKFEEASENLPVILRLGSALRLSDPWLASLDVIAPKDNDASLALGTEYLWQATEGIQLAGRLGYNSRTQADVEGFTGVSFGVGIAGSRVSLDYALLPFGALGLTHRISLGLRWGSAPNPQSLRKDRRAQSNSGYPSLENESLP
jgi:hypothetical protein